MSIMEKGSTLARKKILKTLLVIIFATSLTLMLYGLYSNIMAQTYIQGKITAKYRNGDGNKNYHFVITGEDKQEDISVTAIQYEKYQINNVVYIDYNLFKKAEYIKEVNN